MNEGESTVMKFEQDIADGVARCEILGTLLV